MEIFWALLGYFALGAAFIYFAMMLLAVVRGERIYQTFLAKDSLGLWMIVLGILLFALAFPLSAIILPYPVAMGAGLVAGLGALIAMTNIWTERLLNWHILGFPLAVASIYVLWTFVLGPSIDAFGHAFEVYASETSDIWQSQTIGLIVGLLLFGAAFFTVRGLRRRTA